MSGVFPLFKTTYLEIKRGRAYQSLLIIAFILLASSNIFTFFSREEELKIIKDMGLMAINLFGLLFVLFGLSRRIPGEIEDKTIYTILTNPLSHADILLANLLAYLYVLFISFLVIAGIFYGLLYLKESSLDLLMAKGLILIFFKTVIFSTLVLFFSVFFPPVLNITFSLLLYVAGHLSNYLSTMADQRNFWGWILFKTLYTILPNFENFNCSDALALRIDVSWGYIFMAGLYSFFYSLGIFLLTWLIFKDKEV